MGREPGFISITYGIRDWVCVQGLGRGSLASGVYCVPGWFVTGCPLERWLVQIIVCSLFFFFPFVIHFFFVKFDYV